MYSSSKNENYCTLSEACFTLNSFGKPYQITTKDIFRCAAQNTINIYFSYNGGLLLKAADPFCELSDVTGSYTYSGRLKILDFKYGSENGCGYCLTVKTKPESYLSLFPDDGSISAIDASKLTSHYFTPFVYTSTEMDDDGCRPIHLGTEMYFSEAEVKISEIDSISEAIHSLKCKSEEQQKKLGRYLLEDAASLIAVKANVASDEIENILKCAIKQGTLRSYIQGSLIPISDLSEFGSNGDYLSNEIQQEDLIVWLKENIPLLEIAFPSLDSLKKSKAELGVNSPVRVNKLRSNTLDPAIIKAIEQAGSLNLASVYLKLKELALDGEKPFTGMVDGGALCYTNDKDTPDKLTKNALGKKLKRLREKSH